MSEDIIKDSIEFTSKENLVGNRNTHGTLQELFCYHEVNLTKKEPN